MGLELVEIVMDIEKTFGVSLPDNDVSQLRTVGDLHDLIVQALAEKPAADETESYVFDKLHGPLQSVLGLSAGQIHRETWLVDIMPVSSRRRTWKRLAKMLPWPLPALHRPKRVAPLMAVAAIALAWVCLFGPGNPQWVFAAPAVAMMSLFYFGPLAAFFWIVGLMLTAPLAVLWPSDARTVGDLVHAIATSCYGDRKTQEKQWSDEETWETLRQIITDVLGVAPDKVTPGARLIEDLGAG